MELFAENSFLLIAVRKNYTQLEPFLRNVIIKNGVVFRGKGGNAPRTYPVPVFL